MTGQQVSESVGEGGRAAMDLFPPPGYVPTDSAVPGIEVYQPAPEEVEYRPVVGFKCPQCGGSRAYSIATGGLTCTNCGYHEAAAQPVVGRGAESFEFTLETMQRVAHGWGLARTSLACQQCGAETTVPPNTLSYRCPFCGSNKVVQRAAPQDVLRPRFLVPFQVDAEDCQDRLRAWLGGSWLVPAALRRLRGVRFTAVYLPFWTFNADASAQWRAEVRKTRKVGKHRHYYWRWEQGRVRQSFRDMMAPGAAHVNPRFLSAVQPFDLDALVPYDPTYLAGLRAQAYETTLDQAWDVARRRMRAEMRRRCESQPSSSTVRNFSMTLDYGNESWRYILLPVFLASYTFRGRVYQVLVNGQSGKIAGQRPADWGRIGLLAAGWLFLSLLLILIPQLLLAPGDLAAVITASGFFVLAAGFIIMLALVAAALRMDDD